MNRLQRRAVAVAALAVSSCRGRRRQQQLREPSPSSIRGQTITVLVPYKIPQEVIDSFTKATGVKVNYVVTGWDATHSKLVVANTAHTYIADVAEFDWSFTGSVRRRQVGAATRRRAAGAAAGRPPSTDAAFKAGGKTYAACFSNDFRISMYNKKIFARRASRRSRRRSTELGAGRRQAEGVGRAVPDLDADGGDRGRRHAVVPADARARRPAVRHNFKPAFATPGSAGYKALQWEARRSRRAGSRPARCRWTTPRARQVHGRRDRDPARHRPGQPGDRERPGAVEIAGSRGGRARARRRPAPARRSACPRGSRSRRRPRTSPRRPRSSSGGRSRRTRPRSTRRRAACRAAPGIKQLAANGQLAAATC